MILVLFKKGMHWLGLGSKIGPNEKKGKFTECTRTYSPNANLS